MQNRRRYVRVPAGVDATCDVLSGDAEQQAATARNFSVGGLCLVMQERHEVGDVLKLAFRLGEKAEIVAVLGRVAWVEEFRVGSGVSYDTGLSFLAAPKHSGDEPSA